MKGVAVMCERNTGGGGRIIVKGVAITDSDLLLENLSLAELLALIDHHTLHFKFRRIIPCVQKRRKRKLFWK